MVPDENGAIVIANSNYFSKREGLRPRYVILHGTAGGTSAQSIANYFASTQGSGNPVSSHYIVGTDGVIVQCVSESDGAYANGYLSAGHDAWWDPNVNPNNITIGIEHVKGSLDNSDALTPSQQDASFKLIYDICQRWNIPMCLADANGGITGHFSIDPVNRSRCPGSYPWDQLWAFLKGEGDMGRMLELTDPVVQRYFTDGGNGSWKCKKSGVVLFGGNLTFYRSHGGPALFGLPLASEIYLPQYPNTAIVPCERALIVYDPGRKIDNPPIEGQCYLLHIDSGIGQQLLTQQATSAIQRLTEKMQQIHALSFIS
jgi:N-acetyl-anhydromuramyl-L-alanine amidase AmpD